MIVFKHLFCFNFGKAKPPQKQTESFKLNKLKNFIYNNNFFFLILGPAVYVLFFIKKKKKIIHQFSLFSICTFLF